MKLTSAYRLGIRLAIIAANDYILWLYHHDNEIAMSESNSNYPLICSHYIYLPRSESGRSPG